MEEKLEELYELLDLYFRIEIGSGIVRTDLDISRIEPSLDLIIVKEEIIEKIAGITCLIMEELSYKQRR